MFGVFVWTFCIMLVRLSTLLKIVDDRLFVVLLIRLAFMKCPEECEDFMKPLFFNDCSLNEGFRATCAWFWFGLKLWVTLWSFIWLGLDSIIWSEVFLLFSMLILGMIFNLFLFLKAMMKSRISLNFGSNFFN